jgi:hypothetical protein
LKDIGTDESLDQLVQLLASKNQFIRTEAAKGLAGLIRTRTKDLKDRAALLPDRKDCNVWPLDQMFPANLAIPMAEALVNAAGPKNGAIIYAMRAIQMTKSPDQSAVHFLGKWRNITRDLQLSFYRRRVGIALGKIAYITPLILWLLAIGLELWCYQNDKTLLIQVNPLDFHVVDRRLMVDVAMRADEIITEFEQHFPPDASGISRILPWNWSVDTVVPEYAVEGLASLKRHRVGRFDPYGLARNDRNFRALSTLVPNERFEAFDQAKRALTVNLPNFNSSQYLIFRGPHVPLTLAALFVALMVPGLMIKWTPSRFPIVPRGLRIFYVYSEWIMPGLSLVVYLRFVSVNMHSTWDTCFAVLVGAMVISAILENVQWPRNPLLDAVDYLIPVSDLRNRDDTLKSKNWPRFV